MRTIEYNFKSKRLYLQHHVEPTFDVEDCAIYERPNVRILGN